MPTLPEGFGYLVDYLDGMGVADWDRPHNYSNLQSWCGLTGIRLSPWEAETLINMSQSFFAALRNPDAPPPYDTEASRRQRLGGLREALSRKTPPKG